MATSSEKYAEAIAELQSQRALLEAQITSIDTAIAALSALQGGAPIPPPSSNLAASPANINGNGASISIELDTFHSLTTAQSIKKYLGMRNKKPATTSEIVEALRSGGQAGADGDNFSVVVNNSLNRMSAADGEVSKVRKGIWGLKSWYTKAQTE